MDFVRSCLGAAIAALGLLVVAFGAVLYLVASNPPNSWEWAVVPPIVLGLGVGLSGLFVSLGGWSALLKALLTGPALYLLVALDLPRWGDALTTAYILAVVGSSFILSISSILPISSVDSSGLAGDITTVLGLTCGIALHGLRFLFEWVVPVAIVITLVIVALGALLCLAALFISRHGRIGRWSGIVGLALAAGVAVAVTVGFP